MGIFEIVLIIVAVLFAGGIADFFKRRVMHKHKYAVFTMDVEAFTDTECVSQSKTPVDVDMLDGFDEYIKILDRYGIKSTLFTVGKLAPKIADRLKKYIRNGHELALHSYEHIAPMTVSVESFREQTLKAKKMLGELFGREISGFRSPYFSIDGQRRDVLKELGFKYDSSHLGFLKARHTVDLDLNGFRKLRDGVFCDNGFYEFELSKQKVFGQGYTVSGGGYVRLGNWEFIKSLIKKYIKANDYYVFYLHPFELTHQKIPFLKDLKSYDKYYLKAGIASYVKHIEQIIQMLRKCGYTFVTFEELSEIMNEEARQTG